MLSDILSGIFFITTWIFFRFGWNADYYEVFPNIFVHNYDVNSLFRRILCAKKSFSSVGCICAIVSISINFEFSLTLQRYAVIQLSIVIGSFIFGTLLLRVLYKVDVLAVTIPQLQKHMVMLLLSSMNVFMFVVILVVKHDGVTSFIFPNRYKPQSC